MSLFQRKSKGIKLGFSFSPTKYNRVTLNNRDYSVKMFCQTVVLSKEKRKKVLIG